jgi:hypothetical protein
MSTDVFRFIQPPEYKHEPHLVLTSVYKTLNEIVECFTTHSHNEHGLDHKYQVFVSFDAFLIHLQTIPIKDRIFHEVIFDQSQKLKFDIDASLINLDKFEIPYDDDTRIENSDNFVLDPSIAELLDGIMLSEQSPNDERALKYDHIIETIKTTVINAFFVIYGQEIPSMIVCESKPPDGTPVTKYSTHLIIDTVYVKDSIQAREFSKRVYEYLPKRYRIFLDMSVNKRIQNFRIAGCHKGDMRVKRIVTDHVPADTIITNTLGCELLPDLTQTEAPTPTSSILHPDDVKRVFDICSQSGIYRDHKFNMVRGSVFMFNRLRPSHCEFCNRMHDADNTVMVNAASINGVITVFKQCRRFKVEAGPHEITSVMIGEFPSSVAPELLGKTHQEAKRDGWVDQVIMRTVAESQTHELFPNRTMFDDLPIALKDVYSEPKLKPFKLSNTLIVHAMMKMGKTKALRDYITRNFSSDIKSSVIRYISFRQTFSGNIKEKFDEFTLYSDVKGNLTQDKLIIQVESLHRLDISPGDEPPDLLILDECESIFEQFDSGLLRSFSACFSKFQYLLKFSRCVVCMDANISDRTYRILKSMRPGFGDVEPPMQPPVQPPMQPPVQPPVQTHITTYHCNRYRNGRDDKYYLTGNKSKWLSILYTALDADDRIAIPISSLSEAKTIERALKKKYPEKRIKLYSSENTMSEKKEHFSDVNIYWAQYDVLIYTPTVSAGVSFELKHFNKIFGFFTDQSCPVETCSQMIGRIRDVADHMFYVFVAATGNTLPVDIDAIKQQLYNRRENLMNNFDETGLRVEFGPTGEITYHTSDYFNIWLENVRVRNISRNSFIRRFIHVASFSGAQINYLTDEMFEQSTGMKPTIDGMPNPELIEIASAHAGERVDIKNETNVEIASARDLTYDELDTIKNSIMTQQDVSHDDRRAYEKHKIRADYKFEGEITATFVAKYRDPKVRRMFKNVARITFDPDPIVSLAQIQSEEKAVYKSTMDMGLSAQYQDINRKYVYDQHRYAIGLLRLCGWSRINDQIFIHLVSLSLNLRNGEQLYWETIRAACIEFQIRVPILAAIVNSRDNNSKYTILMIKPINKILMIMYGIGIKAKPSDPEMFYLSQNTLFTTNPKYAKSIPLIVPPTATIELFDEP